MVWKQWLTFGLGIAVIVLPFLGFPNSVDLVFFFFFGAAIALASFLTIREIRLLVRTVEEFIQEERKVIRLRKEKLPEETGSEEHEKDSRES